MNVPFIKKHGGGAGFGDGSDGSVTISSAVQWETTTGVDHTGFVVKQYKNLSITSTASITPMRNNKGVFLFCTGDCSIDGLIDLSKLGSTAAATVGFTQVNLKMLPQPQFANYKPTGLLNGVDYSAPLIGAAGAAHGTGGVAGHPGIAGVNGQLGGGGSGNDGGTGGTGGAGGTAQAFGGGGGGATGGYCGTGCGNPGGDASGCAAGAGNCGHCGWGSSGGAGIPPQPLIGGGYGGNVGNSEAGVGGHFWLFVRGNLTLGPNCRILSNGARGGQAGFGGGGGSGGGTINIFYKKNLYTTAGYTLDTSGGLSGISTPSLGVGGAGSLRGPTKIKSWS